MRIGIMPGSFNPPHLGHLQVIKLAKEEMDLDEIWMLPFPQSPRKTNIIQLDIVEKTEYCRFISQDFRWIRVFDYAGLGISIDPKKNFRRKLFYLGSVIQQTYIDLGIENAEYLIICGSDSVGEIKWLAKLLRWTPPVVFRATRAALSGATFIISPRFGDTVGAMSTEIEIGWGKAPIKTIWLTETGKLKPYDNISSSQVRTALAEGRSAIHGLTAEMEAKLGTVFQTKPETHQ